MIMKCRFMRKYAYFLIYLLLIQIMTQACVNTMANNCIISAFMVRIFILLNNASIIYYSKYYTHVCVLFIIRIYIYVDYEYIAYIRLLVISYYTHVCVLFIIRICIYWLWIHSIHKAIGYIMIYACMCFIHYSYALRMYVFYSLYIRICLCWL